VQSSPIAKIKVLKETADTGVKTEDAYHGSEANPEEERKDWHNNGGEIE
jgi:hypothetical protein